MSLHRAMYNLLFQHGYIVMIFPNEKIIMEAAKSNYFTMVFAWGQLCTIATRYSMAPLMNLQYTLCSIDKLAIHFMLDDKDA